MSTRNEWYAAYSAQRRLRGRAFYVARSHEITDALRKVLPPVVRIERSTMISGKPASCLKLYPPAKGGAK